MPEMDTDGDQNDAEQVVLGDTYMVQRTAIDEGEQKCIVLVTHCSLKSLFLDGSLPSRLFHSIATISLLIFCES